MIKIIQYTPNQQNIWDILVSRSKNSFFQFYRDYMGYHSDRFHDNSLLFFNKTKLVALLPANLKDSTLYSHQGLTFGGFVLEENVSTELFINILSSLVDYLKEKKIHSFYYKILPSFYCKRPSEEILYALFQSGAKVVRSELSTTINLLNRGPISTRRKRSYHKAQKAGLVFKETDDFESFWEILESQLKEKYKTKPTHTLQEIVSLQKKFSQNIKLYGAYKDNKLLAGVVMYTNDSVAHAQYISSSQEGMHCNALDGLFEYLIRHYSDLESFRYFDFGISTENSGKNLNHGLIKFKEEFGGSGHVHITLLLSTKYQN